MPNDYATQEWHDQPQVDTPVAAARLGHMEAGIAEHVHDAAAAADHLIVVVTNPNSSSLSGQASVAVEDTTGGVIHFGDPDNGNYGASAVYVTKAGFYTIRHQFLMVPVDTTVQLSSRAFGPPPGYDNLLDADGAATVGPAGIIIGCYELRDDRWLPAGAVIDPRPLVNGTGNPTGWRIVVQHAGDLDG